jgi:dihydrofolate reductase
LGKVIAFEHLTIDGVMQAPGRPDEDRRGGFAYGGWGDVRGGSVLDSVPKGTFDNVGALLLGRRTYENFYSYWPNQPEPNPFTAVLNNSQKYVASTTLREPLPWMNSTLLSGDAAVAVARLKEQLEKDLLVLGSSELVQALLCRNLVDVFVLPIHPLVLGSGRRLFSNDGAFAKLQLVSATTTPTGVLIAIYEAAKRP